MAQVDWQRTALPWARMVAIDPGLSGTGIVLFERGPDQRMQPIQSEVFTPRKTKGYVEKSFDIATYIHYSYVHKDPFAALGETGDTYQVHGVMEYPAYQEGATRQMGWKTGDLQKLTYLVGFLSAGIPWNRLTLVMPRDWKGQLHKDVVQARLTKLLGADTCESLGLQTHAWDALGIGLHILGRFGPEVQNPLPSEMPSSGIRIRRHVRT